MLQVLASLAGLGALSYGVGAAILWLRYQTTGFNADEALSVATRGQVVFHGFRWVAGWGLAVALLDGVLSWLGSKIHRGRFLRSLDPRMVVGCLGLLTIIAALFSTWSALTLAVDVLAITTFVFWARLRQPRVTAVGNPPIVSGLGTRRLSSIVVFVAALATLSAIGWRLEVNLPYIAVQYRVQGQNMKYDGIYFGEANHDFYIARRPGRKGQFFREISVYPADHIYALVISPGTRTLCTRVNKPLISFEHLPSQAVDMIEQHFRRTGQPNPTTATRPTGREPKNPPPGFCPPLP